MISSISSSYSTKSAAMKPEPEAGWETATWKGSRRAQLRSALELTVRERLEALEAMAEIARRLAEMPRKEGALR